jgi:hypothetical protein
MNATHSILTAHSCAPDARQAVREFHAAVVQPEMALVLFFCSSAYDREALAEEMKRLFTGVQVVGCTTAGEIGPAGYREHSLSGASFAAADFAVVGGYIDELQQFETTRGQAFAENLLHRLEQTSPNAKSCNTFALLLIDGLSVREEPVTWSLQNTLGQVPLIGGSAGDGLNFQSTYVFAEGRFHADSAALVLVNTALPFRAFKTQHFVPTEKRVVVTAADAPHRIVTEIDGWPAVEGYARLLGIESHNLDAQGFAEAPIVVVIDGTDYVRSIQKANPDGSLTFYCAIEEGLVLRLARGVDLVKNLEDAFAVIEAEIGPPQSIIGFDCILRRLEITKCGLEHQVDEVFGRFNVVGFNTYGEQFHDVHVNQTLTGIAIGRAPTGGTGG